MSNPHKDIITKHMGDKRCTKNFDVPEIMPIPGPRLSNLVHLLTYYYYLYSVHLFVWGVFEIETLFQLVCRSFVIPVLLAKANKNKPIPVFPVLIFAIIEAEKSAVT